MEMLFLKDLCHFEITLGAAALLPEGHIFI